VLRLYWGSGRYFTLVRWIGRYALHSSHSEALFPV